MDCKGFQENLYEYIDGSLADELKKEADEHLAICADCRSLLEEEYDFTNDPFTELVEQTEGMELKEETIKEITKHFGDS